jgi:hypothetical protein
MKYYLTLFILKDGERTHMGEVTGEFLCTVLTQGEPNNVTLTVKQEKNQYRASEQPESVANA